MIDPVTMPSTSRAWEIQEGFAGAVEALVRAGQASDALYDLHRVNYRAHYADRQTRAQTFTDNRRLTGELLGYLDRAREKLWRCNDLLDQFPDYRAGKVKLSGLANEFDRSIVRERAAVLRAAESVSEAVADDPTWTGQGHTLVSYAGFNFQVAGERLVNLTRDRLDPIIEASKALALEASQQDVRKALDGDAWTFVAAANSVHETRLHLAKAALELDQVGKPFSYEWRAAQLDRAANSLESSYAAQEEPRRPDDRASTVRHVTDLVKDDRRALTEVIKALENAGTALEVDKSHLEGILSRTLPDEQRRVVDALSTEASKLQKATDAARNGLVFASGTLYQAERQLTGRAAAMEERAAPPPVDELRLAGDLVRTAGGTLESTGVGNIPELAKKADGLGRDALAAAVNAATLPQTSAPAVPGSAAESGKWSPGSEGPRPSLDR